MVKIVKFIRRRESIVFYSHVIAILLIRMFTFTSRAADFSVVSNRFDYTLVE
jgi:hypothetical protein